MRAPSEQELANLVEAHIRDEILFREGVALGLDSDDPVIKRRVRQKFEIMSEEQTAGAAPTDPELSDYMAQNAARFTRPARVSFEQIFFDGSRTVPEIERTVAAAKGALASGADPARLGQPTLLPRSAEAAPVDLVARDFGAAFAEQLVQLPQGEWVGPLASGLGAHLVRVSARAPAALPPLDEVRQQVAREWENTRRERSRSESYRKLRERYDVVIEPNLPQARPTP
jgi:parvulin-like peptidyl-prolyl isomerase